MSDPPGSQAAPGAAGRAAITLGILLAATMNSIDTTVVNVALPHLQASLSCSAEQITWVITSYIVASAVCTPLSGWLARRIGIKALLLASVAGFTAASVLCGIAASLPQMVTFRLLQGLLGASLMPLSQVVLLNINPPERHGRAMALYTMGVMVAPVIGPVVGGVLTDQLSWRWCFFINIPAGIASLLLLWRFLPSNKGPAARFDFLGFGSLAVGIAALQLMLDRGATQDWFTSWEIRIEAIISAMALWVYATHTATATHPLFPPALIGDRNFVMSTASGFFVQTLLVCSLVLLPLMMQGVLGYTVMHAGLLSAPRGVVIIAMVMIVGRLDAIVDRKLLICAGLIVLAIAYWTMGAFDLSMTGREILWATMLQGLGQGIVLVPLTTLGFATIPPDLRADASSAVALVRGMGGSIGVALMQAMTAANAQTMHASLAAQVRLDDPVFRWALEDHLRPDTVAGALALNAELNRQASMVAYVDAFRILAALAVLLLPLVLMMRRPKQPS